VGRFNQVKNYPMLLHAAGHLIKNGEKLHIIFIGGGTEESHLRGLATELGITEFVHFLGFQTKINMF
ncbi:MAG: glycosyltransferase, partial [Nitrosopumilaceae archaeon]|nr:glycosyltransferase [Nitrosopumilaceae archaeon]NIU88714.1 glycosyltransferase [Nitrosopumilaceae archaeon]NIV65607.1 glycosyltransferase [Nitrosopumilaceae archaeon]NIX61239.1 glycosyltransferase [Nitrosopumilaceae archaeon]